MRGRIGSTLDGILVLRCRPFAIRLLADSAGGQSGKDVFVKVQLYSHTKTWGMSRKLSRKIKHWGNLLPSPE